MVFNSVIILYLVAATGANYTYIVGVDRTDVLLLCDPEDSGSLSLLRWFLQNGMGFLNPLNLNSESSNLPDVLTSFSCVRGGTTLVTIQICVKGICRNLNKNLFPLVFLSSSHNIHQLRSSTSCKLLISLSCYEYVISAISCTRYHSLNQY